MSARSKSIILLTIFLAAFGCRFALKLMGKATILVSAAIYAASDNSPQSIDDDLPLEKTSQGKRRYTVLAKSDPFLMKGTETKSWTNFERIDFTADSPAHDGLYHSLPLRPPIPNPLLS